MKMDISAMLPKSYPYKSNDAVTAKVINETIERAFEAYRAVALELVKTSPIEWDKLSFNINGDDELVLSYSGAEDLNFEINPSGDLILRMSV